MESDKQEFALRHPTLDDAPWMWRLVRETGVLDENSQYVYLLLCRDFSQTCLVAERDGQLAGFVTAYRPPQRSDVLFIWQVGVNAISRRQGLGLRLLTELASRCRNGDSAIQFVEATVAPSNTASLRLFEALAKQVEAPLAEADGFHASHFRFDNHEAEPLIRIGPIGEVSPEN